MNPAPDLAGRVALVTGASRNLGAEIARHLAAAGARVAINHRHSVTEAAEVLRSLEGRGHVVVAGDVSSERGVASVVAELEERLGSVDVLVNNAGPFAMTPYARLEPEQFDAIWAANLRAVYLTVRRLAPAMGARGWGRVVNISAGSAFARNHSVYSLCKSAMITLTEQLALELGPAITVNCVAPGQIAESAEEMDAIDAELVQRLIQRTPAARFVTRSEVAEIVVAICGPTFDMVTGTTIPVDGGARLPIA